MDEVHILHRYAQYTFQDIMDMTSRERKALIDRSNASQQDENEAFEKAVKGK